ncbi:hypothetical protein [Aminobacter anthyllidis]|nr:hypothetical protein [Aminobacter anthyllidis]
MSEIELSEAQELAQAMGDPEFTYTLDANEAVEIGMIALGRLIY